LAADISRVISSTQGKISGVIMDNTAANKKTWKILKEGYPRMFFQGCVAHGLHLLVKDVFAATKVKMGRAVADYPEGYPFAPLLDFAADCKKVVKYFHNHHAPKAMLKKAFQASSLKSLVMVAPTRWGSLISMFRSLLDGEEVLYQVVSGRDFIVGTNAQKAERQGIVDIVTKPDFVSLLQKAIEILDPIDAAIVYYQSDQVPVSEVYRTFLSKLPSSISGMKLISDAERAYLLQLVEKRMVFMYGDAHGIAYLLDPRYLGSGMSMEKRLAVEELILSHPSSSESDNKPTVEQQQSVFEDYTNFRIAVHEMKRVQTIAWGLLECGRISPLKFWLSEGDSFPSLQQLAKQVFSMVASSAASERNFSAFAFVQTKLRNRLSEAAVEKLVYVRTNNMQFMNQEQNRHENLAEIYDIEGSNSDCQSYGSHEEVVIDLAS
jgi:regulator of replication initiation timing